MYTTGREGGGEDFWGDIKFFEGLPKFLTEEKEVANLFFSIY